MFDKDLLADIRNKGNAFWAGQYPPVLDIFSSSRLIDPEYDFRESASMHGKYSTVFLVEYDLGLIKQWPLILDEALRLLRHGEKTRLFIRFSQSQFLSVFQLAAFFRRYSNYQIELIYQDVDIEGTIVYALECTRSTPAANLSSFEFAVITDGRRLDNVRKFIASVETIRGIANIQWSIAICGPKRLRQEFGDLNGKLRYIDEPNEHTGKAWITRKKNLLVETSSAENLLIAHDRYEIPEQFLEEMFEFGADYSVISPAQFDEKGDRFPDWVTLGNQWSWSVAGMLSYGDYSPNIYINGGVIISKRAILLDIPWSNLLFWNQGEDVELTRSMTERGIIPRFSRKIKLLVTESRPGYSYEFARLPYRKDFYLVPGGYVDRSLLPTAIIDMTRLWQLGGKSAISLSDIGIFVSSEQWSFEENGIVALQDKVALTVDIGHSRQHDLFVVFETPAIGQSESLISLNGSRLQSETRHIGECLRIKARIGASLLRNIRMLTVEIENAAQLSLLSFGILENDMSLQYPMLFDSGHPETARGLVHGWSYPEEWGVWSISHAAVVQIPVPSSKPGEDLDLHITAIGYTPPGYKSQKVGIACNGMPLGMFDLKPHSAQTSIKVTVPAPTIKSAISMHLAFHPLIVDVPRREGQAEDMRSLGIGLIRIDHS